MRMYQEFLKKDFLLAKSRVYYMYNNIFLILIVISIAIFYIF